MIGNMKRALAGLLLAVAVAGCRVIPGGEAPPPPPPPVAEGPSDAALPQDTDRHRVALLVPLSGPGADAGQEIANASTMALLDTNADNLRITTYDTATGAGQAAQRALADGNRLILGPLLASDVRAVLAQARPANVPLITFSNDSSVAAADVFVMGQMPEQSIDRTISYAIGQGARRFVVLVPQGEYGQRSQAALEASLARHGGALVAVERFDRGNTSILGAAERLRARGGFDTVLIAEGPRLAAMAAGVLKDAGAALPSLLGTELWAGDATLTRATAMRGAWFATVADDRFGQFATSYESRFGQQPQRIAALGYDAVLLSLRLARDWQPGTRFPAAMMLDSNGFIGIDGAFRFFGNGQAERTLEVRQINNGSVTVVDAAPSRFE